MSVRQSVVCTHKRVLLVQPMFLAQAGDVPRGEAQENKAQQIRCSLQLRFPFLMTWLWSWVFLGLHLGHLGCLV